MCARARRRIVLLATGPRPRAEQTGEETMSAEQNLRIVQDMYAAFARGDVAFVLAQIDDACDGWGVISATKTGVPWHVGLDEKGKAGAVAFFEALASSVDHLGFEQGDFAATGEHVYATVRLSQRIRATGKTLEQREVIHHFTFRHGKVVRCRVGEDTAFTAAAFASQ
jgi:ketosteroid isomerase-like protein